MELLRRFTRSSSSATVTAGAPMRVLSRHRQVLDSCAGDRDAALVVAAVARPTGLLRRFARRDVLLLTRNRLVVTTQCRIMRRLHLYLNAELHQLTDVTWTPEPTQGEVKLAATAIDGVREHFCIKVDDAEQVSTVDALLKEAFRGRSPAARPATARRAARRLVAA